MEGLGEYRFHELLVQHESKMFLVKPTPRLTLPCEAVNPLEGTSKTRKAPVRGSKNVKHRSHTATYISSEGRVGVLMSCMAVVV